ncbi:MAG: FAD:protein FMN transferase [Nitrospirae bacterium]|nr:FAD:protein FMN transferase [Nitrospirota bacterium]
MVSRTQYLMGTLVTVTLVAPSEEEAAAAFEDAFQELRRLDQMLTTFDSGSEVNRVNAAAGKRPVPVSPELIAVMEEALAVARLTEGAFDPTVGPLTALWGFEQAEPAVPAESAITAARRLVNYRDVILDRAKGTIFLKRAGMRLDLGGIGKGYAAARVAHLLRERGFPGGIVAAAGDLQIFGRKGDRPWRIGIQHPRDRNRLLGSLMATDQAISTSGDYERYFERGGQRYHHLLDPKTGRPARDCQSVTVVTAEGSRADALATGLFVLGPERAKALLRRLPGVEAILMDAQGKAWVTPGLEGAIEGFAP